jgi:hypothetical protein
LCHQDLERRQPVPVVRWTPTTVRKIEAIRDRIMGMCGTRERLIDAGEFWPGRVVVTMQWRKPLTIEEVARMAQTPEVRERKGRP